MDFDGVTDIDDLILKIDDVIFEMTDVGYRRYFEQCSTCYMQAILQIPALVWWHHPADIPAAFQLLIFSLIVY